MSWQIIIYWIGCAIAFVGLVWLFWRYAIESKRELTKAKRKAKTSDLNSTYNAMVRAEDHYGWARVFLILCPPAFAFFWPLGLALAAIAGVVWVVGWLLDKVVTASVKEPNQ